MCIRFTFFWFQSDGRIGSNGKLFHLPTCVRSPRTTPASGCLIIHTTYAPPPCPTRAPQADRPEEESWEWTDDTTRQPMALGREELAEVVTAWPLLSAVLRQAILAIARSADAIAEASLAAPK